MGNRPIIYEIDGNFTAKCSVNEWLDLNHLHSCTSCTSLEYKSATTNGHESRLAALLDNALSLHLQE